MKWFTFLAVFGWTLQAHAQTAALPCGPTPQSYTIHWKPPTTGGTPAGYKLYRRLSISTPFSAAEIIDLKLGMLMSDGTISAVVPGFDPAMGTFASMRAYNAGGESEQSNELVLGPTTSGVCPPPPGAPELLGLAIEQKRAMDQNSQALGQTLEQLRDQIGAPPEMKAAKRKGKPRK